MITGENIVWCNPLMGQKFGIKITFIFTQKTKRQSKQKRTVAISQELDNIESYKF